jgi:anthranilate phosphoribosyltransferase
VRNGRVRVFEVTPSDAGLPTASLSDLKGGDAETNAAAIRDVLAGRPGPFRDIVLLNAAAALVVGERASDLKAGVAVAAEAIASGAAARALERLVAITNA